jgi:thiamine-monophosphate kinase
VPLSDAYLAAVGEARLEAATAGDDYELLFAAPAEAAATLLALGEEIGLPISRVGAFVPGAGLTLSENGRSIPLPASLGYEHRR